MESDMHAKLGCLAVVSFAAIAGCSSATGMADCDAHTTTAAYRDEMASSGTVTSISTTGSSKLIDLAQSSGHFQIIVTDTTPVFERVGEATPRASSECRLAVGQVVEIPLGDGFGDFSGDPPPIAVHQVVIDR